MNVWRDDVFTLDNVYHGGGGAIQTALILGPALFWSPLTLAVTVPVTLYFQGYAREVAQSENDWMAPLRKGKRHKLFEALAWGHGATIVAGVLVLLKMAV